MKKLLLLFAVVFVISSCRKTTDTFLPLVGSAFDQTFTDIEIPENTLWIEGFPYPSCRADVTPVIFNNMLISNHELDPYHDLLTARNLETGAIIWEWDDNKTANRKKLSSGLNIIGNRGYLTSGNQNYCIDLNSGKTIWETDFALSSKPMSIYPEKGVFLKVSGSSDCEGNVIWMRNLGESDYRTQLLLVGSEFATFSYLNHPQLIQNEAGERQVIFIASGWTVISEPQYQLRCFNIDTKEYDWILEDFIEDNRGNTSEPPLIMDGHIFIKGHGSLHKISLKTGKEIWEQKYSFGLSGNYVLYQDLYIHLTNQKGDYKLSAFSLETGTIVWSKDVSPPHSWDINLSIQNDKLTYSNESVFIYSAENGHLLDQIDLTPTVNTLNPVALDYENNRAFCMGEKHLFCVPISQ